MVPFCLDINSYRKSLQIEAEFTTFLLL